MKTRTYIRPTAARKAPARRQYTRDAADFLARHPFCQIAIAEHNLDEAEVIRCNGHVRVFRMVGNEHSTADRVITIPRATQVHHRNKRHSPERLLDQRWWLAVCWKNHDWIETHKDEARAAGYLLPIQADGDGRWGAGNQALATPELMASRIK